MHQRIPKPTISNQRAIGFSVALLLFTVYLFSYRGGFHSVDEVSAFAVTENLVKFGRVDTNQIAWTQWTTTQSEAQGFFGLGGQVYSKKGLAISLAQAPLYWLALVIPGLGLLQTVSLLNAILTAWTGLLIYQIGPSLGISTYAALGATLLYGLGTIAWVYAKYLFSGTLAGFLLTATLALLISYKTQGGQWRLLLAGFCSGLAVLARANNLLLVALFGLYLFVYLLKLVGPKRLFKRRFAHLYTIIIAPLLSFILGAAIAGTIFAGYNWGRTGNPLQTGYDLTIFSPNLLLGLYKLLFSPLRGLFVYSPILVLAIFGWPKLRRQHSPEAWLLIGVIGVTLLLFSAWTSGEGLSWGSRFLVPIIPFFIIALAPVLTDFADLSRWAQSSIIILSTISIAIQVIGVAINPWVYLSELQTKFGGEFFLERTSAFTDYSTMQILGQLRHWSVANSDLVWWQGWRFDGLAFTLSLGLVVVAASVLVYSIWKRQAFPSSFYANLILGIVIVGVTGFLLRRYQQTDRQFGFVNGSYVQALNEIASKSTAATQIMTIAQYDYHIPMNAFKERIPVLGFAQNEADLPPTAYPLLENALTEANDSGRVWLVTVGYQSASPANRVEAWLAHTAFKASEVWLETTRVIEYGLPPVNDVPQIEYNLSFADIIQLKSVRRPATIRAGQILPLQFTWQAIAPHPHNYTIFVQLIDINGALVAQHDGAPQGGYYPTSHWASREIITDQHGLAVSQLLTPGDYRLIAGLYDPQTNVRLTTALGGDFVDLGIVTVTR